MNMSIRILLYKEIKVQIEAQEDYKEIQVWIKYKKIIRKYKYGISIRKYKYKQR